MRITFVLSRDDRIWRIPINPYCKYKSKATAFSFIKDASPITSIPIPMAIGTIGTNKLLFLPGFYLWSPGLLL